MTTKANRAHMQDRLRDLAFLGGQRSEPATLRFLRDNGYIGKSERPTNAIDAAMDRAHEYGLWLSQHRHGDESEDTDRLSTFDIGDRTTWAKAVWRVPAHLRHFRIFDFCLSTGGPEDGFLIVADHRGNVVAGYYYEADWGTFARRRLTKLQAAMVADFICVESWD